MGLVLIAGLVGYLIGPPIVNAGTNLVVIKDSKTKGKARVVSGHLRIDTESTDYPRFVTPTATAREAISSGRARSAGGHLSDPFEWGVFVCGPLDVNVAGAGAPQWFLYGYNFSGPHR